MMNMRLLVIRLLIMEFKQQEKYLYILLKHYINKKLNRKTKKNKVANFLHIQIKKHNKKQMAAVIY